jgi:hypothetical protein
VLEFLQIVELTIGIGLALLGGITAFKLKEIGSTKKAFVLFSISAGIILAIDTFYRSREERVLKRINVIYGDLSDVKYARIPRIKIGTSRSAGPVFNLDVGAEVSRFKQTGGFFQFQDGPLLKCKSKMAD